MAVGTEVRFARRRVILVCSSALPCSDHIVRPLQTLANVVGALREGDYSFRARLAIPNDALGGLSSK